MVPIKHPRGLFIYPGLIFPMYLLPLRSHPGNLQGRTCGLSGWWAGWDRAVDQGRNFSEATEVSGENMPKLLKIEHMGISWKWMVYNGEFYQNGWFGGTMGYPHLWKPPHAWSMHLKHWSKPENGGDIAEVALGEFVWNYVRLQTSFEAGYVFYSGNRFME